ncbi:MAG: hypothetical protein ACI80H_000431 [Pseudoalteromonas distincta]|jgi:hypothetical protein
MSKQTFRKKATGSFFWLFLLQKLPLAFLAGVKLKEIDDNGSITTLRHRWINQNPFRSMYFAAMQMAAELSTGLLLFQYINKDTRFSMLLLNVRANYHKKAVGKITFSCEEGNRVDTYMKNMLANTAGETIELDVKATNESGDLVADFVFVWSCKSNKAQN